MKKSIWLVSLMTLALMGVTLAAYGQDNPAPTGDNGQPAMGPGSDGGMMGGGMVDKLKDKLGLSADQVTKLKDLFKANMEKMKPLRDQMKIDMDTLQQKVDAKASDGDLKKVLDALSADRKSMAASRENMQDQMRAIFTVQQQAKFALSLQNRAAGMRGKMGQMRQGWKKGGKGNQEGNPSGTNAPGNAQGGNGGGNDNQ